MCLYCQYDHRFWDSIIERARDIRILTPQESAEAAEQMRTRGAVSYPLPSTPAALLTRDPAPCGHCGATDHDTDHCPGQGG